MASIGSWCKYLKFRIRRLPWDALERLAGKAYDISRAVGLKKLSVAIWNKWLYDLLCVPDTPEERAALRTKFEKEGRRLPDDFDSYDEDDYNVRLKY